MDGIQGDGMSDVGEKFYPGFIRAELKLRNDGAAHREVSKREEKLTGRKGNL